MRSLIFLAVILTLTGTGYCAAAEIKSDWKGVSQSIQTGQYRSAYQKSQELLKKYPQDIVLLRLQAVAALKLGKTKEAIANLQKALTIDPSSMSCGYFLAQAYASDGRLDSSARLLEEIIKQAPTSPYAVKARSILPQLKNLRKSAVAASNQESDPSKRSNGSIRLSLEHDDNVVYRSEADAAAGGTVASLRFVLGTYYEYRFVDQTQDQRPVTAGAGYALYQSLHESQRFADSNLGSHTPYLFLRKSGHLGMLPYSSSLQASYNIARLGPRRLNRTRGLQASWSLQPTSWFSLKPFYSAQWNDYRQDYGEYADWFSRDGFEYLAGLEDYLYLNHNKLIFAFNYTYHKNDTHGSQFDLKSHVIAVNAYANLSNQWRLTGGVQYQTQGYLNFLPLPERRDDVRTYSFGISKPLPNQAYVMEFNLTRNQSSSNRDFADYKRDVYGLGLNHYF
ncbi:MAG: tetratricopeptide repeat protein [Elusimicrobiota bacterium]